MTDMAVVVVVLGRGKDCACRCAGVAAARVEMVKLSNLAAARTWCVSPITTYTVAIALHSLSSPLP